MIVEFTPAAQDDLTAIGVWIARDNPARAATFVDELIDRANTLSYWPDRFPEIDGRRWPGIRRLNHRGYRIYYRVREDMVDILHIHHGAQRTPDFQS